MDVDTEDIVCKVCHQASLIWDADICSMVCSACGTTDDSPQLVHDPSIFHGYTIGYGKGKQYPMKDADYYQQNNKKECHQTIKNICTALNYSGDARAIHCFDMVVYKEEEKGQFRWGKQANLKAAACVAIAMTESKRGDAIVQIAGLIGEPLPSLIRAWSRVIALLDIRMRPIDPTILVASLHDYLRDIHRPEHSIPLVIQNILTQPSLSMEAAQATAEQISLFLSRINAFGEVPGGPTACAIVIIGIEAELGHSFSPPILAAIEKWLGEILYVPFTAIDDRRRAMLFIFNDFATLLPWVLIPASNEESGQILSIHRVSAIIHAIKDVLQFQNELLIEKSMPSYSLTQAPDDNTFQSFPLNPPHVKRDTSSEGTLQMTNKLAFAVSSRYRTARRPYGAQIAQRMISQMLDPRFDKKLKVNDSADRDDIRDYLSRVELQVLSQNKDPLTRLKALCIQRGGEAFVTEDELFEPGELESYQNPEEVARLLSESHPEWGSTQDRRYAQLDYSDIESDGDGDIDARSLERSRNIDESEDMDDKEDAEEMKLDIDLRNDPHMAMALFGMYSDGGGLDSLIEEDDNR